MRPFLGVLGNGGGEDAWLRQLEAHADSLAADASGISASGTGFRAFDLGGGGIGNPQLAEGGRPFVARFDNLTGAHVWSRTFPSALRHPGSRRALSQRPDGRLVLGLNLSGTATFDGRTLTSNGRQDLVYLQLSP